MAERVPDLKRRWEGLKSSTERQQVMSHHQEIADVILPRKRDMVGHRTPGDKRMQQVYDPTGIHANEMWAAGLHGMVTNPASRWFALKIQDNRLNGDAEIQKFLSETEQIIWAKIYAPKTNIVSALHEAYLDLGAFGTSVIYIGRRMFGRGLVYQCLPLKGIYFAENADGEIDTIYRVCDEYTVQKLVWMQQNRGWQLSDGVKREYEAKNYDKPIRIVHVVEPRENPDPENTNPMSMAWKSVYFEEETDFKNYENGYPEFPFAVSRVSRYSGETWGRGPGHTALPDVKMLQAMSQSMIKTGQRIANPTLWLRDDGVLGPQRMRPGGINYWRGNPNEGVMLSPTPDKLPWVKEDMEAIRERIRTTFNVQLFQMFEQHEMTLGEARMRQSEKMRSMGPLIGRLGDELLAPLIERSYAVVSRTEPMPEVPKALSETEWTVEFVSEVATAQRQQQTSGLVQAAQMIGMLGPELAAKVIQQKINPDRLVEYLWEVYKVDPDLLNTAEEIGAAQQQEQQMMAAQMAPQMAQSANLAAGAAKNANEAGIDVNGMIEQAMQNPDAMRRLQGAGEQMTQQADEAMSG